MVGISRPAVGRIEQGIAWPSLPVAMRLARALALPVFDLYAAAEDAIGVGVIDPEITTFAAIDRKIARAWDAVVGAPKTSVSGTGDSWIADAGQDSIADAPVRGRFRHGGRT